MALKLDLETFPGLFETAAMAEMPGPKATPCLAISPLPPSGPAILERLDCELRNDCTEVLNVCPKLSSSRCHNAVHHCMAPITHAFVPRSLRLQMMHIAAPKLRMMAFPRFLDFPPSLSSFQDPGTWDQRQNEAQLLLGSVLHDNMSCSSSQFRTQIRKTSKRIADFETTIRDISG